MSSPVRILVLLCLAASIQGLESHLKTLDRLEESVEEHYDGLNLLIKDGMKKIEEEHFLGGKRAYLRSKENLETILKTAEERGCPEAVKNQLKEINYSLKDRWDVCFNLTNLLAEYGAVTKQIVEDFKKYRPGLCATTNNFMLCNKLNYMEQVPCFYEGLSGYMDEFFKMKGEIGGVVEKIHRLVRETVDECVGCFGSGESNVKLRQNALLEERCPTFHW